MAIADVFPDNNRLGSVVSIYSVFRYEDHFYGKCSLRRCSGSASTRRTLHSCGGHSGLRKIRQWLGQLRFVLFAPDLSFAGYLAGSRLGAIAYNLAHSLVGALVVLTAGALCLRLSQSAPVLFGWPISALTAHWAMASSTPQVSHSPIWASSVMRVKMHSHASKPRPFRGASPIPWGDVSLPPCPASRRADPLLFGAQNPPTPRWHRQWHKSGRAHRLFPGGTRSRRPCAQHR